MKNVKNYFTKGPEHFNVDIFFVEIRPSNSSHCRYEMTIIGQGNGTEMDNENATSPVFGGFNSMIPEDSIYSNININTALNKPIDKLEIAIVEKRKRNNESFRKEYAVCLNLSMLLEY